MTAYRNFVVHIDYNEKGEGHIIVVDTDTKIREEDERRVSALSFENLVEKIGWEVHLALTDWMVNP